jgi:hypothetical protein
MTRRGLAPAVDPERIALGVQQPWAELILRGVKSIEIRSQPTHIRGRIYLYASKRLSNLPIAREAARRHRLELDRLPRGVIVGSVDLAESRQAVPEDAAASCIPPDLLVNRHAWRFAAPERLARPLPVRFLPYGVWFYPFRRKHS